MSEPILGEKEHWGYNFDCVYDIFVQRISKAFSDKSNDTWPQFSVIHTTLWKSIVAN